MVMGLMPHPERVTENVDGVRPMACVSFQSMVSRAGTKIMLTDSETCKKRPRLLRPVNRIYLTETGISFGRDVERAIASYKKARAFT